MAAGRLDLISARQTAIAAPDKDFRCSSTDAVTSLRSGPRFANHERQRARHGGDDHTMDFAILLILTNTLMAVLIYIIVKLIWQD